MSALSDIQPDDRVLFIDIPTEGLLREVAALLPRGFIVAIAAGEAVRKARGTFAGLENVMFHATSPAEIPWQNGFFSLIVDLRDGWEDAAGESREMARVLGPDGRLWTKRDVAPLAALGLAVAESVENFQVLRGQ